MIDSAAVQNLLAIARDPAGAAKRLDELVAAEQRADAAEADLAEARAEFEAHRTTTNRTLADQRAFVERLQGQHALEVHQLTGLRDSVEQLEKDWTGLGLPTETLFLDDMLEELRRIQ